MPKEERLPLSEDEKVAGLHTIGYEVWMMGQCARMLANGGIDEVVHNADSALIIMGLAERGVGAAPEVVVNMTRPRSPKLWRDTWVHAGANW